MRPNPPLQRCRYLDPTPSWDFGCESMIRNRRSRSRKAGTDLRSREAFTGRSSRRTSDPDPIRSIGSGSVARASNPEFLALSPCVGYRTTEWTIDLILVLLDTCRLKTEREEQTPAPWAIRSPGSSLAQIDAPNQLLASPRVRPMVLPVHAIEPARNHGYRPVRRPTKSPGSLRGFLRLGVCFKAASAPPSARSVRNMRGLQCVVEHGVQRRGDIGGRVRGVEEAGRRAFLQAGRNKRNVVVGIGVFIAGKARIHG